MSREPQKEECRESISLQSWPRFVRLRHEKSLLIKVSPFHLAFYRLLSDEKIQKREAGMSYDILIELLSAFICEAVSSERSQMFPLWSLSTFISLSAFCLCFLPSPPSSHCWSWCLFLLMLFIERQTKMQQKWRWLSKFSRKSEVQRVKCF